MEKELYWLDRKGRRVEIHTMSNRWLNNIRKKIGNNDRTMEIIAELKRRKNKNHED